MCLASSSRHKREVLGVSALRWDVHPGLRGNESAIHEQNAAVKEGVCQKRKEKSENELRLKTALKGANFRFF